MLALLVKPAALAARFDGALRADGDEAGGWVPSAVVQRIVDAPLVVVDVSHRNLNVFYELGITQAFHKPHVIICDTKTAPTLPFDMSQLRYEPYDPGDIPALQALTDRLARQMEDHFAHPERVITPVSVIGPADRGEPGGADQLQVEMFRRLESVQGEIRSLARSIDGVATPRGPRPRGKAVAGSLVSIVNRDGDDITAHPTIPTTGHAVFSTVWYDANGTLVTPGSQPSITSSLGGLAIHQQSDEHGITTPSLRAQGVSGTAAVALQMDNASVMFDVEIVDA